MSARLGRNWACSAFIYQDATTKTACPKTTSAVHRFPHVSQMSKDQLAKYSELAGKQVEVGDFMTYIIKYMMDKGLKLDNTEGMIEASVFPVNYFTLKQVRSQSTLLQAFANISLTLKFRNRSD